MGDFKFKDLRKLGNKIDDMCAFAEDIKARVEQDLTRISEAKTFISDVTETLTKLETKLNGAENTLLKLDDLLK